MIPPCQGSFFTLAGLQEKSFLVHQNQVFFPKIQTKTGNAA
jgi:hypothetical protein